ncbi:MAG: hypothetical protein ABDH49_05900 [Candidatus Hydrothermales bacterium]
MDRFKRRNLESFSLLLIIITTVVSLIEISLLINLNIRIFLFIFFTFIGIALIILNFSIGFFYILTYIFLMPFLRRFILIYEKYEPIELLYLVPDILTLFLFTYLFILKIQEFKKLLSYTEFKILFFLQVLMFIQIFNPIQGSLYAGFGGTKFLLIPSLFSYFAYMIENSNFRRIRNFIIFAGLASLVYSYFQLKSKFFFFERNWILIVSSEYKQVLEMLSGNIRPFSFFSSISEFGQFMGISAIVSLFFIKNKLKYLLTFLFITGIIISGVRSSIYAFLICSLFLIFFKRSNNLKDFIKFSIISIVCFTIIVSAIDIPSTYGTKTYVGRFLQGVFDPLREGSSVYPRLETWKKVIIHVFTKNPFGAGLGVATRASVRLGGIPAMHDSTFFGMFSACGIVGGFLLIYLVLSIIFKSINSTADIKETVKFPLILILFISIGQLLTQYLIGALFWGSIGMWIRGFYFYKHGKYKDNHYETKDNSWGKPLKGNQHKL